MITAQSVTKKFGSATAVKGVSFEVHSGEVLGFLGPNGAGKSTTMRMLTGYLPMTSGRIVINGHDIEEDPIAARNSIGYLPENAPSYSDMTVRGFLAFCAEARGLRGKARQEAVERAVATCHLEPVLRQTIDTLSKGYKHRVCFAQAILANPPILVLDEPTDGLDPNQKLEMRSLIREMGRNKAIIVSTHILEEVEAICTRVIIIDRGTIVFNGTPEELRQRSADAGIVQVRTHVALADAQAAAKSLPEIKSVGMTEEGGHPLLLFKPSGKTPLALIVKKMFDEKGWQFTELATRQGRLDDVFHAITSGETDKKEEAAK
ncbi:MAG: ATP-binding cassette domain-containing protein [Victivallales bacterium]|nr:ATP-binding cassette domain-containing protein [Victivallales bacterium]